ncbi:hypothetical protein ACCAA_790040 [Candidatus Accumulibacter aalborgensis]|uniref:Uncharacterized protein n=1 Tax=Candidatus Accumulibacter aalborgensis TaxID=1860102 RepID=A0A1A8XY22_9PROT|nr:hypothetical protein ACCAA_790040 [Candidatus Accumulibacter aalborgensis]
MPKKFRLRERFFVPPIHESLGLKEVFKDYSTLSEIAETRCDTAAAAERAQKRNAKRVQRKRLAGGTSQATQDHAAALISAPCCDCSRRFPFVS